MLIFGMKHLSDFQIAEISISTWYSSMNFRWYSLESIETFTDDYIHGKKEFKIMALALSHIAED